eukprot:3935013-Rhodomonas_salina.2
MKLNGTLREQDVGKGNKYVSTIYAAISGMVKLAAISGIPEGRVVYRGQKGRRLPARFLRGNAQGVRGGVEMAFLSTTSDLSVAMHYAAGGAMPVVFAIEVGAVDKGAALGFLSQYPDEDEILMPPRSFMEVVGEPSVIVAEAAPFLLVPVKININLQCPTLDQLRESRKTMILSTLEHVRKEINRDVQLKIATDEVKERAKMDIFWDFEDEHGGKRFVESIKEEGAKALAAAKERAPSWFNEDRQFRRAMQDALNVQRRALRKLELWMEDTTRYAANLSQTNARDCERKARGRLRRMLEEAKSDLEREKTEEARLKVEGLAKRLCLYRELIQEDVDEAMEATAGSKETALMEQAAEGNAEAVALLLEAGASAGAAADDGTTALMLAALGGHAAVVRMLCVQGNADPDATHAKAGEGALHYAAEGGHSET